MTNPVTLVLLRSIPARDRDAVEGDLAEEGLGGRVLPLAGIALRYQTEPWRDPDARLGAILTAVVAGVLVTALIAAGWDASGSTVDVYRDPLSRAAFRLGSAPWLAASFAAGLVAGFGPWIPDSARALRIQVAVLLVLPVVSVAPDGWWWLAASLLLAATWLGDRARVAPPGVPPSATRSVDPPASG